MRSSIQNFPHALVVIILFNLHVFPASAQSIIFTNPAPQFGDSFGEALVAVGSTRVLIGAPRDNIGASDAGVAYLFGTNGTLLLTITNPTPASSEFFGSAMAAIGVNKVLIGARGDITGAVGAGAAYLFSTNGSLLVTIVNPTPVVNDSFGAAVAAVGTDKVLIGARGDNTGASDAGAAYLFSTNGALLTTITNPSPAGGDLFGYAVAGVGPDRLLISARDDGGGAGAIYLFDTNGTLLTAISNPVPAPGGWFGGAVAAVSAQTLLVGAPFEDTGASSAGAAYLFSTNGTLLTIITNPTPGISDRFGWSVAAAGTNRLLIGADLDDTAGNNSGAAYLFSTNGSLLATYFKTSAAGGELGGAVAAVGIGAVLIGAPGDDTGATDAGAAYLFPLNPPPVIVKQPLSQSVTVGSSVTFSVAAGGREPLTYEWRFNGTNIPSATASSYTRTNAQFTHEGSYTVEVANGSGSIVSAPALLDVTNGVAPAIISQPASRVVRLGDPAGLAVSVSGTAPFFFHWQFDGLTLPEGTNDSYHIASFQQTNAGRYRVMITNNFGAAISDDAFLAVGIRSFFAVFADDFESGTLGNWWSYDSTPLDLIPANGAPSSGMSAAVFTNNASRMHRNIIADNGGVELFGLSRLTFWLFQTNNTTRSFCEVRGYAGGSGGSNFDGAMTSPGPSGSLNQLLAAGIHNSVTLPGELWKANKYQGRLRLAGDSTIHWFNLDGPGSPNRSQGWHKFQIERLADQSTVRFYVDDVLCRAFTNAAAESWDTLVMGGGLSTTTDVLVDGWRLEKGADVPLLNIQLSSATNVVLSWATNEFDFTLEFSTSLSGTVWKEVTALPVPTGSKWVLNDTVRPPQRFYRLRFP